MNDLLKQCADAVLKGNRADAVDLATRVAGGEHDVLDSIENGFSAGIREAGSLWEKGEYFLPELAFSAEVMKSAMEILRPALMQIGAEGPGGRTVVIGTVQGDIHDIGKSLVSTLMSANGFDVVDLGADVPHARFVEETKNRSANLVCMSALLTTTMTGQGRVVSMLQENGLRDRVKVMVGGAPTNDSWARQIGADAYASDAVAAVRVAKELLSNHDGGE
jgi:corrinoid protein of di/trimethylamine methyltransferase